MKFNDNTKIEDLELCVRSTMCLKRKGISTLGQLKQMTDDDLKRTRNLGMKNFDEIKELLSKI